MRTAARVAELLEHIKYVQEAETLVDVLLQAYLDGELEIEEYVTMRDFLFEVEFEDNLPEEASDPDAYQDYVEYDEQAMLREWETEPQQEWRALQHGDSPDDPWYADPPAAWEDMGAPSKSLLDEPEPEPVPQGPPRCKNCGTLLEGMAVVLGVCTECGRPKRER